MSSILHELGGIAVDLRSEKVTTRNKAAERLDTLLTLSKSDLLILKVEVEDGSVTWTDLFNSAVEATMKHAIKVENTQDCKTQQAIRNKNYLFSGLVIKMIDYNLENNNKCLSMSTIFNAINDGLSNGTIIKHFGLQFLSLLDRGLYKSDEYVQNLKINEYRRILLLLFEMNVCNDDLLRFGVMRSIVKTIELASQHVQIGADLIAYLPEVIVYARKANDDRRKADVIKLLHVFMLEVVVDYRHAMCMELQNVLPIIVDFYTIHTKKETKIIFFQLIYVSLKAMYPYINRGDFSTLHVQLEGKWNKVIKKLYTIVTLEIKDRNLSLQRLAQANNTDEHFIKMSSLIVYLMHWHLEFNSNEGVDFGSEPRSKIIKRSDKLELLIEQVQPSPTVFNEMWLGILSELIASIENILNISNYLQVLQCTFRIYQMSSNASTLRKVRICFSCLLKYERMNDVSNEHCITIWTELVNNLLNESNCDISENQLILQALISSGKLNSENCVAILQSIVTNSTKRRIECFHTVQQILLHSNQCGFDKTAPIVERVLSWCIDESCKIDGKSLVLNITPVSAALIADTCALAVINFINDCQTPKISPDTTTKNHESNLLLYKYNRRFVCIDQHGTEIVSKAIEMQEKTCLFQNQYEKLMRLVNFETSKELSCIDILRDLKALQKISFLMKSLLHYNVFNESNLNQCPLIKRIGLFLSHLELQLKNNNPQEIKYCDMIEILQLLNEVFTNFISEVTLLKYLESQPLDELLTFLSQCAKFSALQENNEFDNWSLVGHQCVQILSILCASSTHCKDSFEYLQKYRFKMKTDIDTILNIIDIYSRQKNVVEDIAVWLVNILRQILKHYHTKVEIVQRATQFLPALFEYVHSFPTPLADMFLVLISLLKICYKKSYTPKITATIIANIRLIMRCCNEDCGEENYTNIALSVPKFLSFSSLEIQFATINTLVALLDSDWLRVKEKKVYFNFCNQLYDQIDWKGLPTENSDEIQNSNAVTVQFLLSVLLFSTYFKERAVEELVYFCALRKLTEVDLEELSTIAQYRNTSLSNLTRPYLPNAVHMWGTKGYPILRFPYFLFSSKKREFFSENLSIITICSLLYYDSDSLEKLCKLDSADNLLGMSQPIARALLLPSTANCLEAENSEYQLHTKLLLDNLKSCEANFLNNSKSNSKNINWETIYYCLTFVNDSEHFNQVFEMPIFPTLPKWFHISHSSFISCLRNSISSDCQNVFEEIVVNEPLSMVYLFGNLKEDCLMCTFSEEKIKRFHKYCIAAELVLDSLAHIGKTSPNFFLRDILFFIMQYLSTEREIDVQAVVLIFLKRIVNTYKGSIWNIGEIINENLNQMSKILVDISERSSNADLALAILKYIVLEYKEAVKDQFVLINEFPMRQRYADLRQMQQSMRCAESKEDFSGIIKSFMEVKSPSIEDLKASRLYISKHKYELQKNVEINVLISRLLELIRNDSHSNVDYSSEAARFLGEIGSIKIANMFYYFHSGIECLGKKLESDEPKVEFLNSVLTTFDKILTNFNVRTHRKVYTMVEHILNSKHLKESIDSDKYKTVFVNNTISSCIDSSSVNTIDWNGAMQLSVKSRNYNEWICVFMSRAFAACGWISFQELAFLDADFADSVIEPFIKLLIAESKKHLEDLWKVLEYFFAECSKTIQINGADPEVNSVFKDKKVVGKFLSISECLRIHNNMNLPINLLNVVKACNYCQAYFMSIMYLELWSLNEKSASPNIAQYELIRKDNFQETATKAYKSIGCCDEISGFLDPLQSRLEYLNLENYWSDILIESDSSDANEINRSILKRNGMLRLAESSVPHQEVDYEICWRLCQWDKSVEGHSQVNTLNDMEYEFEKHHYNALKCLFNREENNTRAAVVNARNCILYILKEISLECLQSMYKYLTWLQFLQHIEDFMEIQFGTSTNVNAIFEKWRTEFDLEYGSFSCKEQVLSHQVTVFGLAGVRANRKIKEFYKENPMETCMLKCIRECRNAGKINLAKRNIAVLKKMPLANEQMRINVLLEDAEICLLTGKSEITKAILHHVLSNNAYAYCLQRVTAFRMQGEYLMETNSEHFENVQKTYFKSSLSLLNKFDESKTTILQKCPGLFDLNTFARFKEDNIKATYETTARYADKEYTQLNEYTNSEEFQMKCRIIQENRQAADSVGKQVADRDKNIGATFMKKFANLDEKEVKFIEEKRTVNLCIAIENYMKFSKIDESISNPVIFRIIALWFTNKQNEEVLEKIVEHISTVPSYKFIAALNQMTARLSSKNVKFINVLKDVLVRCAQDHPQHTLCQLYSLVYAFKDGPSDSKNDRMEISKEIIAKARNKRNMNCIKQMEVMFPALIDYSNQIVSDNKALSMPLSDKLKRLKNLDAVQCPTMQLDVSVNLEYNITSIMKWSEKVALVGGINAPKKLICHCSDGKGRAQLLKGKDDLRQDAVMQQVFSMINDLLGGASETTAARNLSLRTYKVVPLSMRSGILEWCENTIPIGTYLLKARKKYRPDDYSINKCRQLSMQHLKSPFEPRHEIYKKICENVKPIFHFFLFEKFFAPGVWFERRLAYTNSVATTSIVGYILGLGDRHTQNILIDENSAEVIHIDFGIAFEQGKIMPTPETVPFRLTRDMVAPMGISETNGTFKKSCEATMHILRRNQSIITTILEVLLYDPLYIWKVVPQGDRNEKNLTAQRALLCVQNKLEGKQNRILGHSNVEVQVQRLINDATSTRNLCLLYPGWDPYL